MLTYKQIGLWHIVSIINALLIYNIVNIILRFANPENSGNLNQYFQDSLWIIIREADKSSQIRI